MTTEDPRRAPVQGDGTYNLSPTHPAREPNAHPDGTITWAEHLLVYEAYAKRYGRQQSAERLAARGGFGYGEIVYLIGREPSTWRPR